MFAGLRLSFSCCWLRGALRLLALQDRLMRCVEEQDLTLLEKLLFEDMAPHEWRIWLLMRTTVGSQTVVCPPSLEECLASFARIHQKVKTGTSPQKLAKPTSAHVLTVGAKALSKHWHRDRQVGFWGSFSGTEPAKNKHAIDILFKIMSRAVWINLHSLPHDQMVYEVREAQGYGLRWTTARQLRAWQFRGFLEPQQEDGHEQGWVH
ncbi:hypothetical protein DM01DRAFT_1338183 [Hesseltinella vesiculosa]|uniref:Uncharacterized protein n=1 Tax=Hesseltinella vesiculosa TaxID=101127 RepID=A0A1X2GAZ7_9FUNG|nr:hypothetical protein DM01DRAFT_1338183 [Hesseltinella vesiculosa]